MGGKLEDLLYSLYIGYFKKYTEVCEKKIKELDDEKRKIYERLFEKIKNITKPHVIKGEEFQNLLYLFSIWRNARSNGILLSVFENLMMKNGLGFLIEEFRRKTFLFERYLQGEEKEDVNKIVYTYFRKTQMDRNIEIIRIKEENSKNLKNFCKMISENFFELPVKVMEFNYEPKNDLEKFILYLAGVKVCLEERIYYELRKELYRLLSGFDKYNNNPKKYVQNYFRKTNIDIFRMRYEDVEKVAIYILRNFYKWRRFWKEVFERIGYTVDRFKEFLLKKLETENIKIIRAKEKW